ncbi:MAG: hypothetical protein MJA29_03435, partial [Candidatus Omnitrophica bacterium]|nr:hypothetical protein [Candidatus Omnitrophota bacterium]
PRSTAGWFDMDILNLIFPIGIIWTYLCAQEAGGLKRKLLRLGVSGFLVGLFCFTWVNWWFIFLIIMMYETVSIAVRAVLIVRGRVESRDGVALSEHLISFGFFIAGSLFFVIILTRFEALSIWWNQIRDALILNKPLLPSIWPNVFSTVGELRKIKPLEISNSIGGPFVASLSVICMIIIVIRAVLGKTITGFKRGSAFILLLWFLSMLYATFRGVRFSMFLTVPLGIFLGWGINDMITYFLGGIRRWQRLAATAAVVVVFSAILLQRAYRVSSGLYPLMHDRWYEVLIALKEKTPPETVVNSWWDFGDWFKVVAERPVIFDGQSQNKPQAFWMARALLSHNEKESMGILRMLNNGGNRAFELIDEYLHDPLQSVLLLETVLPLDEAEARRVLSDFLPSSALDEMLLLLFDEPPAAEFLVDYSLVFKITAISYLGNWNFAKVYMVQNYNRIEKERIIDRLVRLGKDRSLMQKFYQEMVLIPAKELERWISRPVQYFSTVIPGKKQGDAVVFENGFVYKPEEKVVYANDGKLPRSLFLKTGNHIQEFLYQKPGLVFSTLIWENEHGYFAVLLDPALGRALFTRLYFLDGMKSRHFLPHIRAFDGGNFIGTYKIQW